MPVSGYTGISFPFRISPQGGVAMSTTDENNPTHIVESLHQILGTHYLQRVMEPDVYSDLISVVFEPNDETLQAVAKSRILDAIERLEPRVEVTDENIKFSISETDEGIFLFATITFKVIKYGTWYTSTVKVGEVSE